MHALNHSNSLAKTKIILFAALSVLAVYLLFNLTNIKYFIYYKTQFPEMLAKLRGDIPIDNNHVITTIGGRLTLNGGFPFSMPIIVSTQDTGVSRQIRAVGSWEPRNGYLLLDIVKPGSTVVEIGANYGYFALLLGHAVGPEGKVYAFEANPVVYKYFTKSIALNDMQNVIIPKNIAISDQPRNTYIVYNTADIGTGYIINELENLGKLQAPWVYKDIGAVTLSAALPSEVSEVDLLRMDIEGSEFLVIKGAHDLIEKNPNMVIMMEWDLRYLQRYGNVRELVDFFSKHGYKFWTNEKQGLQAKTAEEMATLAYPSEVIISKKPVKDNI